MCSKRLFATLDGVPDLSCAFGALFQAQCTQDTFVRTHAGLPQALDKGQI